jgi:hypothetical protein
MVMIKETNKQIEIEIVAEEQYMERWGRTEEQRMVIQFEVGLQYVWKNNFSSGDLQCWGLRDKSGGKFQTETLK